MYNVHYTQKHVFNTLLCPGHWIIIENTKIKKKARNGDGSIDVKEDFEEEDVRCLKLLNKVYQGAIKKSKNPHPEHSIGQPGRIMEKIGGWKKYASQRKPCTIKYKLG